MFWSQFTVSLKHTPGQRIIHSINKKCFATCYRCYGINGLPIQRNLPFLRNDTECKKKLFFAWRLLISHIIRHCKFVLQGACTFLKKTQRYVLFKLEQRTRRRKKISLNRVFSQVGQQRVKNAHGRTCKKTKVYNVSIYLSLYENLFENGCVYMFCVVLCRRGHVSLFCKAQLCSFIHSLPWNGVCRQKFHGKSIKLKNFPLGFVISLCGVVVRYSIIKLKVPCSSFTHYLIFFSFFFPVFCAAVFYKYIPE